MEKTLVVDVPGLGVVPAVHDAVLGAVPLILETDSPQVKQLKDQYVSMLVMRYGFKPFARNETN